MSLYKTVSILSQIEDGFHSQSQKENKKLPMNLRSVNMSTGDFFRRQACII